jgi:two-component system, cell cycle sensor histidine kinase and response regulator CckA
VEPVEPLDADQCGLMLDNAPDAIVISRADGRIALANRRAHEMFGYPPGTLPGMSVDALVPEEARVRHPAHRAGYLASTHPPLRRLPLRGRRADGTVFAVEVSLSAVTGPDGRTFTTSVLRDDTAHREAQQARALLASVVQSSHDAIVTTDLSGIVLSWNPGAERLYGHAAGTMIGTPIDAIIPPERRGDEEEIRSMLRLGGRVDRYRSVRRHADGRPLTVSVLASPLRDPAGAIVGIAASTRDISEREQAEAQVQAVLDAAPDALLGVDEAGAVVLVNAEAERLFGAPRYELVHVPVDRLIPDGLPPTTVVLRTGGDDTPLDTDRPTVGGGPHRGAGWATRTAERRNGDEVPVDVACSALRTNRGVVTVAVVRDITERLAAQAEEQRLRQQSERQQLELRLQHNQRLESLGQLAGGVAHDFNNLLAVILNYANFIIEDAAGTPIGQDAEQIARAARRGSDLTHQLLAFARREVIRPKPLDVNAIVVEVWQMLHRSIGEHITLTTNLAPTLPAVRADPGQLEQVLVNLAVNARDAMPTGGEITIDTAVVDVDDVHPAARAGLPSGRYVRLRVSDTGAGMPKDVADKAFDPFFTTKPAGQGTGLGLATVYGIIAQSGGTAQIYSEPGWGTTITVLLPTTDDTVEAADPTAPSGAAGGGGATVLLVEDEDALREVTARILRRSGYRVITATDGSDALATAQAYDGHIDILLTDVIMPGILGKDLADTIVTTRPDITVVFMSGYAQPVLTSHGTLAPDVALVEKPFTSETLLAAIQRP